MHYYAVVVEIKINNVFNLADKIKAFNQGRLPDMLLLKYEAMNENTFRFFRGSCHLFYEQLHSYKDLPPSPKVWICGDLHLENFGSYKGNNKLVYFDLNDFDEAVLGPALWEVMRLVTSIFIAFQSLDIGPEKSMNMATLFLKSYANTLSQGKAIAIEPRTSKGIVRQFLKGAQDSTYTDLLEKRTQKKGNKVVLNIKDERHFKINKALKRLLKEHLEHWLAQSNDSPYHYKVKDIVFRVAGTGSLGQRRYLFLIKSTLKKNNYLLVDMKEAFPSSVQPYLKNGQTKWNSEAERIITIQKRMQYVSASLLSSTVFQGSSYVIQELQPVKDTIKFKLIKDQYRDIYQVIDDMAVLTASSQLRSAGIQGSAIIDELMAFGQQKNWQNKVLDWTRQYAVKVQKDFLTFKKDYESGVFI